MRTHHNSDNTYARFLVHQSGNSPCPHIRRRVVRTAASRRALPADTAFTERSSMMIQRPCSEFSSWSFSWFAVSRSPARRADPPQPAPMPPRHRYEPRTFRQAPTPRRQTRTTLKECWARQWRQARWWSPQACPWRSGHWHRSPCTTAPSPCPSHEEILRKKIFLHAFIIP